MTDLISASTTFILLLACLLLQSSCTTTSHGAIPLEGTLSSATVSSRWLEQAREPGKITMTSVESARWAVDRAGLINLDHEKAIAAGLEAGDEPIGVYMHVLTHPDRGTYMVDSGVAESFRPGGEEPPVSALIASQMHTEKLDVEVSARDWLSRNEPVQGIFLTHLHLDHIMGLPDFPDDTLIVAGPEETTHRRGLHMFTHGTADRLFEGKSAVRTWEFGPDPEGIFEGIADIFGDGQVYALHIPGHTRGSTAFLVRTTTGPVLLTGDGSHTAWGWEHCVEPGSFNADGTQSAQSLKRLKLLEEKLPTLQVKLGHQELNGGRSAKNTCT